MNCYAVLPCLLQLPTHKADFTTLKLRIVQWMKNCVLHMLPHSEQQPFSASVVASYTAVNEHCVCVAAVHMCYVCRNAMQGERSLYSSYARCQSRDWFHRPIRCATMCNTAHFDKISMTAVQYSKA